jgi:CshA-type fibril repeat protein
VTTTYTPTVIGPPNAVDDATSGPFNTAQSDSVLSDDTASSGATLVANSLTLMSGGSPVTSVTAYAANGTTVQGVYTLGANNKIVFTPEPGFVGTATAVTYRVTDSLGQTDTATYTPTINPPALPVADPDTSTGPFNTPQVKPVLTNDVRIPAGTTWDRNTLTLMNGSTPVTSVTAVSGGVTQGVYTIDANKNVVFTPAPGFEGTATPVTYQITDSLGRPVTTTYTPTVIPPNPVAVPDTTRGPLDQPQSMFVLLNDNPGTGATLNGTHLMLWDPVAEEWTDTVVTDHGTYTISASGNPLMEIIFTPVTGFIGTATPVTYQMANSLGRVATTTYTPTIVPPTPIVFEVNIPTLSHTGMGPIGGTVMLIATLLGTGAFAVVASRRARKNAA